MDSKMDALKKREKQFLKWLKEHQYATILAIFGILLAVRIYYFISTLHQPIWWDEGDYLNIARWWAFGSPEWSVNPLRPLLFPFMLTILVKIGLGEFFFRLIPFISSIASVGLVYLIGKELYDKRIGVISAITFATFWSFLFFTYRILVDVPVAFLWLLAVWLFLRGYEQKSKKHLLWFVPIIVLGFLMKYTGALLVFILIVYLFITDRFKPLFNKTLWKSVALSLVAIIPFLWYEVTRFGHPLAFYIASIHGRAESPRSMWQTLIDYINVTLPMVKSVFLVLFILGFALLLFELVIGFDLLWKNKEKKLKANLLLVLMFLVPFLYIVSLGYGAYIEERYLFLMYPFMFIIGAKALVTIADFIKKYSKRVALIVVIVVIAMGMYQNITYGDDMIMNKKKSFLQVQQAAEWVNERSEKDDLIFVHHTQAEFQYAANRRVEGVPGFTEEELLDEIRTKRPKFLVMNIYVNVEQKDMWKITYPFLKQDVFKEEIRYEPYLDKEKKIPIVTVFSIKPEFYKK